ncbi:MAG: hypothetical protein QOI24_4148 [Acidobacteriota bacterium]|jgi:predicted transporter|nr:hypothetical protein [Acidobacteriota bacterium]
MLRNHIVLMFIYAVCAGVYFALLWRSEKREQIKMFAIIFCSLFFGGIALAWLMYPFPLR